MSRGGWLRWGTLIARYFSGQAAVQAINLVTGFLVLRLLSVEEYGVYILASLLQAVASVGSDMGISQAIISIGAPIRDERSSFTALLNSAYRLRRVFLAGAALIVIALAYATLPGSAVAVVAIVVLILATAWAQQSVTLGTSVLNIHHAAGGLTSIGMIHALFRMTLVVLLCAMAPYAWTVLAINLFGTVLAAWLLKRRCVDYTSGSNEGTREYSRRLLAFASPLMPGVVYYILQGQISIFLLGVAGAVGAVAEVGALGRLGQVIGSMSLINGFFIQPYFARISDGKILVARVGQVIAGVAVFSVLTTTSSLLLPELWLALLGPNYTGLGDELVIAIAGAQIWFAGSVLFAIVVAQRATPGQWIQIVLSLAGQIAYIGLVKLDGPKEALILNLIPAAVFLAFQALVLARLTAKIKRSVSAA